MRSPEGAGRVALARVPGAPGVTPGMPTKYSTRGTTGAMASVALTSSSCGVTVMVPTSVPWSTAGAKP